MEQLINDLISNIGDKQSLKAIMTETVNSKNKLSRRERDYLWEKVDNFKKLDGKEIIAVWLLLEVYGEPDVLPYIRKKGVFRYSSNWDNTEWCIRKTIELSDIINVDSRELTYLKGKINNNWLRRYYNSTEKKLRDRIYNRYKHRIRKNYDGYSIETSLTLELMAFVEGMGRFTNFGVSTQFDPGRKNEIEGYSMESIAEAVSYLLHLCIECIPISDDKSLWLDPSYVLSKDIQDLVVEAAKYRFIQELEVQADYLCYSFDKAENEVCIKDLHNFDKSIRAGYSKYELQRDAKYVSVKDKYTGALKLSEDAERCYKELKSLLFSLRDEKTILERYIMTIPKKCLDNVRLEYTDNEPHLYTEEAINLSFNADEMFLSTAELLEKRVTKDCTVVDIIQFKRYFQFISLLKDCFFAEYRDDSKTMVRSMVPVIKMEALKQHLFYIFNSKKKVEQLIELFMYTGEGVLDIQYTPIIKLSDSKIYLLTEMLTNSDLIRNSIVRSRQIGNKETNTDGTREPLEEYAKELFAKSKYAFNCKSSIKYSYMSQNGEIDLLVWTDENIYLFECKNNINPTSAYEMRTTIDYIEKACKQLTLSELAFNDEKFRNEYFKNWGLKYTNQNIHSCILMGNRVFSACNEYKYPVRYIYELELVINSGIISGSLGVWSAWEKDYFQEKDLNNYISKDDPFNACILDGMIPYTWKLSCNKINVNYETYGYNFIMHSILLDNYLRVVDKKLTVREEQYKLLSPKIQARDEVKQWLQA